MYKRWQEEEIKQALKQRRIVILSGSRQCGKTTTSKNISNKNILYRTLDDYTLLQAARENPEGFVKLSSGTMVIDEIQKAPELISAIKKAVDENTRYGQFLVTGSVNLQNLPTVKESLAGRVKKIRLRPLCQGEILGNTPKFFDRIHNRKFINNKKYDKSEILKIIFNGGYPEPLKLKKSEEKVQWYKDYINTIIEYDLKDISNIKRQDYLKELAEIIASYSSKFIDKSKITSALGIASQTLDSYLNVLLNTYLVDKLHPWLKTDYERINKQSKFFMTDTGLMTSLLNWEFDDVFLNADKSGKVFETFVYTQLIALIELNSYGCELFHYRDREKREIDFIIQTPNNEIYAIEVKSGSSVNKDSFKHIKWFGENLVKNKLFTGIVLYTGENVLFYDDNMIAVPMNNLWE